MILLLSLIPTSYYVHVSLLGERCSSNERSLVIVCNRLQRDKIVAAYLIYPGLSYRSCDEIPCARKNIHPSNNKPAWWQILLSIFKSKTILELFVTRSLLLLAMKVMFCSRPQAAMSSSAPVCILSRSTPVCLDDRHWLSSKISRAWSAPERCTWPVRTSGEEHVSSSAQTWPSCNNNNPPPPPPPPLRHQETRGRGGATSPRQQTAAPPAIMSKTIRRSLALLLPPPPLPGGPPPCHAWPVLWKRRRRWAPLASRSAEKIAPLRLPALQW